MLGPRIAALRRAAGMNQAELAARLKISPSAVGMYEQGRREPSADILVAMSDIFGVSLDYLIRGEPSPPEAARLNELLLSRLEAADRRLGVRRDRPFSRQELAVLFAALLMD